MALPGIVAELAAAKPAPVGSLISSAASPSPEHLRSLEWTGGIRWNPDAVKSGQLDTTTASPNQGLALSDAPVMPFNTPHLLEDGYRGSALGNQYAEQDFQEKARRALITNQSRLLELEFWDGRLARTNNENNFFLSNNGTNLESPDTTRLAPVKATDVATALTGGPSYKVRKAFGALEKATMEALGGSQCFIHVPIYVVPYLANAQIISTVGPLLLTKLGNVVVAGVGYTGSAPGTTGTSTGTTDATQDTAWIYGTGVVTVWLQSEIMVQASDISQSIDKTVNLVEFRAARFATAIVNPAVNVAAKLDLANS